jgi:NAD(P)-dependent dehydrogenase (short-subunit alcohol dehydrogenase family)
MASQADASLVWLITGCSKGFGREIAYHALQRGYRVMATARAPDTIADLVSGFPNSARSAALDVTDDRQARAVIAEAERAFGRIDVLVNNAGYGYLAAVEEGEEPEIRSMFEVNFFAVASLIRLVLPGMRARRCGHIVNISSVGGLVGNPASGYYAATKFALEGLSEALSKEVAPHGIRVTLIEPGPFRTNWAGPSLRQTRQPIAAYSDTAGTRRAQLVSDSGRQPGDPKQVAAAILQVVASESPPLRLVLGRSGLQAVRDKLASLQDEIRAWEELSLTADFPPHAMAAAGLD